MTDRATLESLFARVLEGTGPDRELDADIARALGWKPLYRDDYSKWWPPSAVTDARERKRSILHHPTQPLPMFTASLDAALTLAPEGWRYDLSSGDLVEKPAARLTPDCAGPHFEGYAQTVPRALIAACIKAKGNLEPQR